MRQIPQTRRQSLTFPSLMKLEIKDLHASAGDREILKGLTLELPLGQVAAIMGPNLSLIHI